MRRSVYAPGVPQHQNPIPHATVLHGLLVSSAIGGREPASNEFPQDKDKQVALAFAHMQAILRAAGATLDDVIKLDLYFTDKSDRKYVNPYWLALFPDAASRPARHAHIAQLPAGCCLQIELMAVLPIQRH